MAMNISKSVANIMQYLSEAVARIFAPSDDMYPIQPFEGEPYKKTQWAD